MTEFRQRLRYWQARWREAAGYPIGTNPIVPKPGKPSRLVGSRLPLDFARETGANFVTRAAREAVGTRTVTTEPHQSFDHQRLWADLLWAPAAAFNLFGDLAADIELADAAIHGWWPDAPGRVTSVRFVHSPGRFDMGFTGNLVDFDVAFYLDIGDGAEGIVGVDVAYHDSTQRQIPKPIRLWRYLEVAERSGLFSPAAIEAVNATRLTSMWLEHLLIQSMIQHPSGRWSWGRYVVVHPEANLDYTEACRRYAGLLSDRNSFTTMTFEDLIGSGALRTRAVGALRRRYLAG